MEDKAILAESHSAEAINAQAVAAEAIEKARESQLAAAVKVNREETLEIFTHAMRAVLTQGDEGTKSLLIQKIPLLCTDMLVIKADIKLIKTFGGYILLGIGGLFITIVGALLTSHL